MALRHRIAYLRTEHAKLLELAEKLAQTLGLASSKNFAEQRKSLARLRAFNHPFDGIAEHCHAEDRIVESIYHRYLDETGRSQISAEHERILRVLGEFREELRFATADRTASLVGPGMEVVNTLRTHVSHEEAWLGRISKLSKPSVAKRGVAQKPGRTRSRDKRQTRSKQNTSTERERRCIPYTMESHPEL